MPKFTPRPPVIEARQWNGGEAEAQEIVSWASENQRNIQYLPASYGQDINDPDGEEILLESERLVLEYDIMSGLVYAGAWIVMAPGEPLRCMSDEDLHAKYEEVE